MEENQFCLSYSEFIKKIFVNKTTHL